MKGWPLLRWITRYLVLALLVILLLVIVLFNGLGGLGLPALFWGTESVGKQLFIGIALSVFFAVCSLVGFLLDWGDEPVPDLGSQMRWYFRRTFVPLTLLVSAWEFRRLFGVVRYRGEWGLPLGCLIGTAAIWYGSRVFRGPATRLANTSWFSAFVIKVAAKWRARTVPPANVWYHAYATIVFAVLAVLYLLAAFFFVESSLLPAAVAIVILLLLVVLPYGLVRFYFPRAAVFVVLGLVLLGFLTNLPRFKHRLEKVGNYDQLASIDKDSDDGHRLKTADVLNAWLANAGKYDTFAQKSIGGCIPEAAGKPRAVIMMASGGGIRAAVWMAAVMRALDAEYCGFSYHTKLITGASGGLVGAAYYLAQELPDPTRGTAPSQEQREKQNEKLIDFARDSLDPVTRYLALRDVPWFFVPFPFEDRGRALEEAWGRNAPHMRERFTSFAAGEAAGWRPSMVLSPMMVEDGRQLLISNLVLDDILRRDAKRYDVPEQILSVPSVQFFDVFPGSEVSIATASRMAASFPWVSPASELSTSQVRRTVDAGYFDNYGGYVAAAWLRTYLPALRASTAGVLVVQIVDHESDVENRKPAATEPKLAGRVLSEVIAPIDGGIKTRDRAMNYRNDFDLSAFTTADGFVSTVIIELPKDTAALSWNLTRQETQAIAAVAAPPSKEQARIAINSIKAWWAPGQK